MQMILSGFFQHSLFLKNLYFIVVSKWTPHYKKAFLNVSKYALTFEECKKCYSAAGHTLSLPPLKTFAVTLNYSRCLPGHRERTVKGICREVLQNARWFPHVEERWCTCWNSWVYWDFSRGSWYWKVNFYCFGLLENVFNICLSQEFTCNKETDLFVY